MSFFIYLALIVLTGLLLQWLARDETDTPSDTLSQQDRDIIKKYSH